MLKKLGPKETIKRLHIVGFLIAAIILFFTINPLTEQILTSAGISIEYVPDKTNYYYELVTGCVLYGIWGSVFFISCRDILYSYYTDGRNYQKDHAKYKKGFSELEKFFKNADPYKLDLTQYNNYDWRSTEGVILGRTKDGRIINIPSDSNNCDGFSGMIQGRPGSGKTAGSIIMSALRFGVKEFVDISADPPEDLPESSGSVFCTDLKNDVGRVTRRFRRIKFFDLINPENSCHFDPFAGVERMPLDDRTRLIENLCFNVIPQSVGKDSTYFRDTANDYFCGIALYLLDQDISISFPEVIDQIIMGDAITWRDTVIDSDCKEAQQRLKGKATENEKNLGGGYSYLCTACRKFASHTLYFLFAKDADTVEQLLGEDDDLTKTASEKEFEFISPQTLEDGYDVYLEIPQADLDSVYAAPVSMIVSSFLNAFLRRESNLKAGHIITETGEHLRPILMILDEFTSMSTLPLELVENSFKLLRSRSVSILAAYQSRQALAEMFSEKAVGALTDCTMVFVFLSIQDVDSRKWASELIGTKKELRVSKSFTAGSNHMSTSVSETDAPIIPTAEFGNLIDDLVDRDQEILYIDGKYTICDKLYYFGEKKKKKTSASAAGLSLSRHPRLTHNK